MRDEKIDLGSVSTKTLARCFGLTPKGVRDLAAQGVIPREDQDTFGLEETVRAYVGHLRKARPTTAWEGRTGRYVDERTKLTAVKADIAEMERKRLMGEIVEVSTLKAAWGAILSIVRQRLLAIPSRCAPRGAGKSATELAQILREDVNGILTYLEKTKVAASDLAPATASAGNGHSRTNGGHGTAARSDAEPVG